MGLSALFYDENDSRHKVRVSLVLIGVGAVIEVLVIVATALISYSARQWSWDYDTVKMLHGINSVIGLLGTFILVCGMLLFIKTMQVSSGAKRWINAACVLIILFRAFDVILTVWQDALYPWLKTVPFAHILVSDALVLGCALTLLIGLIWALYDGSRLNFFLQERNTQLDREIVNHQEAEARAQAREKQLAAILNALSMPVFLADRQGVVLAHNKFFGLFWGQGAKDLVGAHLRDVMPQMSFEAGKKHALGVFDSTQPNAFTQVVNERIYEVGTYPVTEEDGSVSCVTVLAQDMTDRLREEEERRMLEAAFNNTAESIIITDAEGRIKYVNPAFEKESGYTRSEVMGQTPSILKSGKHDADLYRHLWQTIKSGSAWRGRLINRCKDGTLTHENVAISPITNDAGAITHFVAVERNVTRELELEQQVLQSQKLESLGTLAGGIAHDMNNVLAIILGHSELMSEILEEGHPARGSLKTIMRTASRSSMLIKRLLMFSRQRIGEAGPLCIAPLIEEQAKFMRTYLPSNIQVIQRINVGNEIILAEPSEVQQIFVNLVNNANHAMQPNGGVLDIGLNTVRLENDLFVATGRLEAADYVCLSVSDTGTGMDAEIQRRIFEPFFTTKDLNEGTGLGLPMVHGSVLRAGGQIDVKSAPGQGTCIDIFWPKASAEELAVESLEEEISGTGMSVLVIDDMIDFAELLAANLRTYGFIVTAISDPKSAVAFYHDNSNAVNVVVVDYMMPAMNGGEVAQALHQINPDLPVILLSGYASGITPENANAHGFCATFEKPLEIAKLARALSKLRPAGLEKHA